MYRSSFNSTTKWQKKLIKDLLARFYTIYDKDKQIGENLEPNQIPGFLLDYCAKLEKDGFQFKGNSINENVSNLEIRLK